MKVLSLEKLWLGERQNEEILLKLVKGEFVSFPITLKRKLGLSRCIAHSLQQQESEKGE